MGCEESNIYIDSVVSSVTIQSCVNCTIFVAAVTKVCTIEKCENTTLIVASSQLRVGNCIDSLVHSFTPNYPPIVYGDTRNLRMAPHNAMYAHMPEHLTRANIRFEMTEKESPQSPWFTEAINHFRKPIIMGRDTGSALSSYGSQVGRQFSLLPTIDFNKLVLPW